MTPNEQWIAIAEACGWKWEALTTSEGLPAYGTWHLNGTKIGQLPDYLNDLNAMHEAEKKLYEMEAHYYALRLCKPLSVPFTGVHATARQRAEAFLRTIGKWKESE